MWYWQNRWLQIWGEGLVWVCSEATVALLFPGPPSRHWQPCKELKGKLEQEVTKQSWKYPLLTSSSVHHYGQVKELSMCAVCLQREMFLSHPLEGPDVAEFCKHRLSDSCSNQNWSPWQLVIWNIMGTARFPSQWQLRRPGTWESCTSQGSSTQSTAELWHWLMYIKMVVGAERRARTECWC